MLTERIQEFVDVLTNNGVEVWGAEKLEHSTDAFRVITSGFVYTVVGGSDTPTVVQLTQTQYTIANPELVAHAQQVLISVYPALMSFFDGEEYNFVVSSAVNFIDVNGEDESVNLLVGPEAETKLREFIIKANYSESVIKDLAKQALSGAIKDKVTNEATRILKNPVIQTQSQSFVDAAGNPL